MICAPVLGEQSLVGGAVRPGVLAASLELVVDEESLVARAGRVLEPPLAVERVGLPLAAHADAGRRRMRALPGALQRPIGHHILALCDATDIASNPSKPANS